MSISSVSASSSTALVNEGVADSQADSTTTLSAEEVARQKYIDELLAGWKEVADKYDVTKLTPYRFIRAAKSLADAAGATAKDARAVQRFVRWLMDEKDFDASKKYDWTEVQQEYQEELSKSRSRQDRDMVKQTGTVLEILTKLKDYVPLDEAT